MQIRLCTALDVCIIEGMIIHSNPRYPGEQYIFFSGEGVVIECIGDPAPLWMLLENHGGDSSKWQVMQHVTGGWVDVKIPI